MKTLGIRFYNDYLFKGYHDLGVGKSIVRIIKLFVRIIIVIKNFRIFFRIFNFFQNFQIKNRIIKLN
jgi:hypothetical protein